MILNGRQRLTYTAMSVLIAWHSLAIVVAPMSGSSVTAQGLRALLQPYLTLFRLDNSWDFFSPSVNSSPSGSLRLSYVIENEAGKKLGFMPEAEYSRLEPRYFWFRGWHFAVISNPEDYADIAAAYYCRKHAALHPVSITLFSVQDKEFTLHDFLAGKQRWDPGFFTVNPIKLAKCSAE